MVSVCSRDWSTGRYGYLHFVKHDACADDDGHHLILGNVEAFLHGEQLGAHEAAGQGNAPKTHKVEGVDKILGIEAAVDKTLERLMAEKSLHVGSDHDAAMNVVGKAVASALHAEQFVGVFAKEDVRVPCLAVAC